MSRLERKYYQAAKVKRVKAHLDEVPEDCGYMKKFRFNIDMNAVVAIQTKLEIGFGITTTLRRQRATKTTEQGAAEQLRRADGNRQQHQQTAAGMGL